MLALMVSLHRKAIKLEELPRFNLFKKKQYLPLVQLLRLATLLNNQRQATTPPDSLTLHTDDNHWTLTFSPGYFAQNTLAQLDLEKEQDYWQEITGWKLLIEEAAT